MAYKATDSHQPLGNTPEPSIHLSTMSAPASDYSKQGDTPSLRLSNLGYGPRHRQQHTSSLTSANEDPEVEPSGFRIPKYIEKGNPLQDEEKLLRGLPIVEPGDEAFNTIRKVPSDQALMPLRWGRSRRASGRSKSGLQILVPSSNAPISLIPGGAITGKSIIYTYTSSSSSSSGRTTSSFGAVGEHLTSTKSAILPRTLVTMGDQNPTTRLERADMSANSRTGSPLADLVLSSTPDEEPYQLLALGQIGPWKQPFTPQLVKPSNLSTLIQRRRSLSDLKEAPQARQCTVSAGPGAPKTQVPTDTKVSGPDNGPTAKKESLVQPDEVSFEAKDPPVWSRKGLPFEVNRARSGLRVHLKSQDYSLDPETFSLPFGSKVFIMKSTNVYNLRASVEHGVWSSTKGANRVLQNAWENRKPGEKIVFIFSITHSHRYSGKYCGLAEMSGPFDPEREVNIWTEGLQGNQGVIPTRWIVAKDVEFSVFHDLTYNDKPVSQLRHANTVPGEAGRQLVQRYFEAEHSATAIIHPKTELATSSPDKRDRRSTPPSASNSGRRVPWGFPPHPRAPAQNLQPAYRSIYGQAVPAFLPYSGYAPLNNRIPPAQSPYGTVRNSRGDSTPLNNRIPSAQFSYGSVGNSRGESTTYPHYGHGSSSFRY